MKLPQIKNPIYQANTDRFIELDVLRGFAIIFMIFLHVIWDLDYFGLVTLNTQIYQFQKIVPTMFFILLGICLVISKNKKVIQSSYNKNKYNKYLFQRGLKVFGFGIIITIITMIFIPDRPIYFGVLHCIGFSIILSIPFLKFNYINMVFGPIVIFIGLLLNTVSFENPTVIHLALGLHQGNIAQYTIDYFPIFPWFGACLIGMVLGNLFYKNNERRFSIPDLSKYKPVSMFSWLGQHSLIIYLLHQPIIAGTMSVFILF